MKKIALIGIGKMGMSHLAIAKQTPGLEVKAVCDTSKALLRVISKNTNLDCYSDYKKMITNTPLDAVMVLVPNRLHFEVVKYCLEKGLHVFVEKPFTLSYDQSNTLVELADRQHLKGQVGYVNRFNPVFQKVKKLLEQNAIGKVSHYMNRMTGGVILNDKNTGWRNDYEKGGGCLFDYGPHCFDLATYFFGTEVEVQSASLKRIFSTRVDDMVFATLNHNDGITGINYINWSDSTVRKATNSIEIMGTKGKIVAGKQECSLFITEENKELNFTKGWNQLYITDVHTDVSYYLRGEEFSRQLLEFSDLVNGKISTSVSSLYNGSITDKIISEIKELNGALK